MHIIQSSFFAILIAFVAGIPSYSYAAETDPEVAGWIPYWRDSQGIKDAKEHLEKLDIVFPFAFTVTTTGILKDQAGLDEKDWKNFKKTAQKEDIAIIPTVMWSDGVSIHTVLSNAATRKAHIENIVDMVEKGKFDGVDIDYESKKSETIDYFSLFLKELKAELDGKMLTCAIEARTPPESLYKEVPETIAYANDYKEIAKYCDRVEIMTYDQQRADIKLNAEKAGEPYMPVSDADWARKVVELALKDIPKEKILVGVPTYGRHWMVTVAPNWYSEYTNIGALNLPDAVNVAKKHKVAPSRNRAGELSFTYVPKATELVFKGVKIPKNTPKGNRVATQALAYANKTGKTVSVNMVWYSDAEAIKQKIDLAKEYGLAGVAIFKIDGEEDQKVWNYLK